MESKGIKSLYSTVTWDCAFISAGNFSCTRDLHRQGALQQAARNPWSECAALPPSFLPSPSLRIGKSDFCFFCP